MRISTTLFIAALGLGLTALPAAAQYNATINTCGGSEGTIMGHIDWPATNPLWSFDFIRPANSTGENGSGLELRDVYYDGHKVFDRAHVPILNVEYEPGGCGCFRDWSYAQTPYYADGIRPGAESCFADATAGEVETTCEFPTGDSSAPNGIPFDGIAVEEFPSELVLTGHMSASWYRYRMKWHFYTDGRIWPEYSMSSNTATCTGTTHRHHAYWRFDFDLDGTPNNDVVREINPTAGTEITFTTEDVRTWGDPADGIFWDVRDETTGFGYQIVPGSEDLLLPVDPFSRLDAAIAVYDPNELEDGATSLGHCPINLDSFPTYDGEDPIVNGETLTGEDIVFWYRSSGLHVGNDIWECNIVGPTLNPILATDTTAPTPEEMPNGYVLERAYPNPFNPSTTVRFKVAEAQNVTLVLIDALGRQVAELFNGRAEADKYESIRVDGSNLPSGAYTVRLEGETVQGSTRIVLIK